MCLLMFSWQCIPPAGIWGVVVLLSEMLVRQCLSVTSGTSLLEAYAAAVLKICQVSWWGKLQIYEWLFRNLSGDLKKKHTKEAKLKASCYNLFLILIVVLCRCWLSLRTLRWLRSQPGLCRAQLPLHLAEHHWRKAAVRVGVLPPFPPNSWFTLQQTSKSCRSRCSQTNYYIFICVVSICLHLIYYHLAWCVVS